MIIFLEIESHAVIAVLKLATVYSYILKIAILSSVYHIGSLKFSWD